MRRRRRPPSSKTGAGVSAGTLAVAWIASLAPGAGSHFRSVSLSRSSSTGLERKSFIPACMHRSRCPTMTSAVRATIGMLVRPAARMRRVASYPSMSGRWQSINTRSYSPASSAWTASRPVPARSATNPSFETWARTTAWFVGLSSATRIRLCHPDMPCPAAGRHLSGRSATGCGLSSSAGQPKTAVNQKVDPAPSSLSTPISPPIVSASCRDIARPRPVPPYLRVVEASA